MLQASASEGLVALQRGDERMHARSLVVAVVVLLAVAAAAAAQQGGSSIRGRVVDQQRAVLPGVPVLITHQESGLFRETQTTDAGT